MGRAEKLFHRLDALEDEYRMLAAREFSRWIHDRFFGRWSLFLVDKMPFLKFLKYPSAAEQERVDEILHVENEIVALRLKLDQPMSESPVHQVRQAAVRICAAHDANDGTEVQIAKILVKDLGYYNLAEQPPA